MTQTVEAIQKEFGSIGKAYFVETASNPKYLEVCAQCDIIEFEKSIQRAGFYCIGIGLYSFNKQDWYMAWVAPL